MVIDVLLLIGYVLLARIIILNIIKSWFKDLMGPVLGAIPLVLINIEFVEDSFINVIIALPAFFYLIILSGKDKKKIINL
jgi:hypothetical protein